MHCILQNLKKNAQVSIYSLAGLKKDSGEGENQIYVNAESCHFTDEVQILQT